MSFWALFEHFHLKKDKTKNPRPFPNKRRFCSKDDHHCLNVMLMYELQKTETKPKTTIIQYFIALNYIINYYKTVTNKPSLN